LTRPLQVLRDRFGYRDFAGPQAAIIEHVLKDRHALVLMPTGAGKSICFQIPAMILGEACDEEQSPLTLVLSPLIALMKDQVDALRNKGIEATFINSSLDAETRNQRYREIAAGKWKLLYVTPERFRKDEFVAMLAQRRIVLLAVDEAHCISEWGHDFRPDYTRLAEIRRLLGDPTTIALTATATREVQADIIRQLGLSRSEVRIFNEGIGRPNLSLAVESVWGMDEKLDAIESRMRKLQDGQQGSGIVYFTLIRTLEEFAERLEQRGLRRLCYHGDLSRESRKRVQDAFMNGETAWVLATNAFGMGIDKPNIRYVLHAEVPGSLEAYYQEIGRAGRDGQASECLLLYDQSDLETQMEFMQWSNPDADFYHRVYDLLRYDVDRVRAFGLEWLRLQLSGKNRRDRRLETALGMLQRYGVIADETDLSNVQVVNDLPISLGDPAGRAAKLDGDRRKLMAVVEYVRNADQPREFLEAYFGGAPE
jgi:ATP-dependent DNA helicase RecQ